MAKLSLDEMQQTAIKMRMQEPLLNDEGIMSFYKLAKLLVKEHSIVSYKGLFWTKVGHGLNILTPNEIATLAITMLNKYSLVESWQARDLPTLLQFIAANSLVVIDKVPWNYAFFSNCVVDLCTSKVIPESEIPENMIVVHVMPVKFDPKARAKILLRGFRKSFTRKQQVAFLSILGARLTGADNIKTHMILSGVGNQAKGSWRVLASKIFGARMCQTRVEELHSRFGSKVFIGCDIVWNAETDGKKDTARIIKDLTGGTQITIESKGIDRFSEESVQAVFCEDTNNPSAQAVGAANDTRLEWIQMECQFVKPNAYKGHENDKHFHLIDPNFNRLGFTDQEISGFLNLLIPFAKYYLRYGDFKMSANKSTQALTEVAQSITSFIDKFIEVDRGSHIRLPLVQKKYNEFCAKIGTQPQMTYTFRDELRLLGGKPGKKHYMEELSFNQAAFAYFMLTGEDVPELPDKEE
ncbi:MAG: hypothetical protein NTW48_10280 [Chloroflexi bacterium]|nr:hypothetical protein [Chloroflexota bacterium]